LRVSALKEPANRALIGKYAWNGSTVPSRKELSKSMSKGCGVTAPLSSTFPDFGIFIETVKVAGPVTGQLMSFTSADRSVTVSVVRGLTASSLNASSPLRKVTCSTFTLKSAFADPSAGGAPALGAGAAPFSAAAAPFSFGGPARATRSIRS